jgi:hypothetical protein
VVCEKRESSDAYEERRGFVDDSFGLFLFSIPSGNISWLFGFH